MLNPALRKGGGGPKPGGGIDMVTGKVGGTRPTAGTVCATGILKRPKVDKLRSVIFHCRQF